MVNSRDFKLDDLNLGVNYQVPYSVGSYVVKDADGIRHLDQIHSYVIDGEGISVVLILDVFCDARLSTKIKLEDFNGFWKKCDDVVLNKLICDGFNQLKSEIVLEGEEIKFGSK